MYSQLPHKRCTRLLHFLASDELLLQLTVLDIDSIKPISLIAENAKRYQALSYTWGPPLTTDDCAERYHQDHDVTIAIEVDGQRYAHIIGRNLYEALLQIRDMQYNRPLWVDAICINQVDTAEKEAHILLMGEIYTKSQRTLVWLGKDGDNDFEHIIWLHETLLDRIDDWVHDNRPLTRLDIGTYGDGAGICIYPMGNMRLPGAAMLAYHRLHDTRRYFQRAWILQEVGLAPSSTALLGNHHLDLKRISRLAQHIGEARGYIADGKNSQRLLTTRSQAKILGNMTSFVQLCRDPTTTRMLHELYGHADDTLQYALLEFLFGQGARRDAFLPHDSLYSLLGIIQAATSMPAIIEPQYALSPDKTFTQVATQQLLSLPYRTVLSLVKETTNHASYVARLPSWVPDFATVAHTGPLMSTLMATTGMVPDFNAGKAGPTTISIVGPKLMLFAHRCSSISYQFHMPRHGMSIAEQVASNVPIMQACQWLKSNTMDDLFGPLFRTICLGEPDIEDEAHFRTMWRRHLAAAVVDGPRMDDSAEVLIAAEALKTLYADLNDNPYIPTPADIYKEEVAMNACFRYASLPAKPSFQDLSSIALDIAAVSPDVPFDMQLHTSMATTMGSSEAGRDMLWGVVQSMSVNQAWKESPDAAAQLPNMLQMLFLGGLGPFKWVAQFDRLIRYASQRVSPRYNLHNTFFVTRSRHVGRIEASRLQPEDELWLICNAKVPFILRPVGDEYRLVGEAYVHGAMRGELIDDGTADEPRQITII